jgi:hypothetical protein
LGAAASEVTVHGRLSDSAADGARWVVIGLDRPHLVKDAPGDQALSICITLSL